MGCVKLRLTGKFGGKNIRENGGKYHHILAVTIPRIWKLNGRTGNLSLGEGSL